VVVEGSGRAQARSRGSRGRRAERMAEKERGERGREGEGERVPGTGTGAAA
jgi:hypothetical protein